MSTYTLTLAAGVPVPLPGGDVISIMRADYPLTVELKRDGQRVERAQNVPVSWSYRTPNFDARSEAFDEVSITSATAQTVQLDISRGIAGVNAISGTVDVAPAARALNLNEFAYGAERQKVPGHFSYLQLWNPADSGVRLIVAQIRASRDSAGDIELRTHDFALTPGTTTPNGANKYLGGAVSAAELRIFTQTTVPPGGDVVADLVLGAGVSEELIAPGETQWVVPPDYGLTVVGGNVNVDVSAYFRWSEVADA